jgi:hypothetical protein
LTKATEAIIAKDSGALLRQRDADLEVENSRLKATAAESAGTISTLQRAVDIGVEDYTLLMEGNKNLLPECDDAKKEVADLEMRVKSAEAHSVDVAASSEECLRDFEDGLVRDLAELRALYMRHT